MDRVQDIANAIAALRPADKQRLFRLLTERGELPAAAPVPVQLPMAPQRPHAADYVLTFDGGSKGNPGLGYGSYAIVRVQDGARRIERLEFAAGTPYETNLDFSPAAPERVFELVVPWLVLLATLLLLVRDLVQKRAASAEHPPSRRRTLGVAAALGLLSVYGGYFGAGMGILTLAVISFTKRLDIHQLNALKNIVVGAINTTAAVYFVISGTANLPAAAAMAVGAAAGGYFAARIARRVEPRVVSWVVAGIGVALSAVLAVRYWL